MENNHSDAKINPIVVEFMNLNIINSKLDKFNVKDYHRTQWHRGIAQPGSALGLGPRGRKFESCCPDHLKFIQKIIFIP
jgi:hypothetical protein